MTEEGGQVRIITSTSGAGTADCGIIWVFLQTAAQVAQGDSGTWPVAYTSYVQTDPRPSQGLPSSRNYLAPMPSPGGRYYARIVRISDVTPGVQNSLTYMSFNGPGLTQTVTLSPNGGAAAITNGQTFSGTATGAQAGNPYNISIISGQGSAAINSSTGAYTITANGAGLITYKVWVSAGGGYDRSADAQASIAVSVSKQVRITIPANNGAFPIEHRLIDVVTGQQVGTTFVQGAGAGAYIVTVDVPSGNDVTLQSRVVGAAQDDHGNWYVNDEAVTDLTPSAPITPQNPPSDPANPNPATPAPNQATPGTPAPDKGGTKIVWTSGAGSMDPTQQVDLLTNSTYKEGIQNLIDKTEEFKRLFEERKEVAQGEAEALFQGKEAQAQSAKEAAEANANQFRSAFQNTALVPVVMPDVQRINSPLQYRVIGVGGIPTSFNINLNLFNNPSIPPWVLSLISFSRLVLAVTAIGMYYLETSKKCREALLYSLQVNREGPFLGERVSASNWVSTATQITIRVTFIAVIISAIMALPAVIVTIMDVVNTFGFSEYSLALRDLLNSGGVMGTILSLAVGFVPIPTLLAVFMSRIATETAINMGVVPVAIFLRTFRV